jgi:hypothetical protein
MRAVLSKVDAAEAKHHAGLRESAWRDKQEVKAKPCSDWRRPTWSIAKASPKPSS